MQNKGFVRVFAILLTLVSRIILVAQLMMMESLILDGMFFKNINYPVSSSSL